jgi:hypothetical protein
MHTTAKAVLNISERTFCTKLYHVIRQAIERVVVKLSDKLNAKVSSLNLHQPKKNILKKFGRIRTR